MTPTLINGKAVEPVRAAVRAGPNDRHVAAAASLRHRPHRVQEEIGQRLRHVRSRVLDTVKGIVPNVLIGIGNTNIDAEAYGSNDTLTVIIDPEDEREYGAHAIAFRDWRSILRLFDLNRATLENPASLAEAIRNEEPLAIPITAWREP
jgi:hypothetical protein